MQVAIPVYVEERQVDGEPRPRYLVRRLLAPHPRVSGESLAQATRLLARRLRHTLAELVASPRHDDLAAFFYRPRTSSQVAELELDLRQGAVRCRVLIVHLSGLGARLAFVPTLPRLWFRVERGEDLEARTTEVLAAYFRRQEKEPSDRRDSPARHDLQGRAWVTSLELEVPQEVTEAAGVTRGQAELERVGDCLDRRYPEELAEALLRDEEVVEVRRALEAPVPRPVLLVGDRLVGKSAIIEEVTRRRVEQRRRQGGDAGRVWHLSPQRLIAGMAYVGQWEERLLAILTAARERGHVLYVDDVPGLFGAGVTRDCSISLAHVLRPVLQRHEVSLVGEITPRALSRLREMDRGFADLFQVIPVRRPTPEENRRILLQVIRQLEGRHRCRFGMDVLPVVEELGTRFQRDAAFPGKGAVLLQRLASRHAGQPLDRATVLAEFQSHSGLPVAFLDHRRTLPREEIVSAIGAQVVGQGEAVEALADVVSVARAGLADPRRPLGSFLFVGPTGVGKTSCALALARYLFGDPDRLVRIDMNELPEVGAAARLTGTLAAPEGLLTAPLRRQPFAVILLDEIEKAHPEALDLLLQVLGDGRLTDALGRTADFTSAIVIMTSNLGVRESIGRPGFGPAGEDEGAFEGAVERFFRPELLGRIDRVIRFRPLDRLALERIATQLIEGIFNREGLLRRRCVLEVDPGAIRRMVERGHDPQLGARALRRALEEELTRPVARCLASRAGSEAAVVTLVPGAGRLEVRVQSLPGVTRERSPQWSVAVTDVEGLLERVERALARIQTRLEEARPAGGVLDLEALPPGQARHYLARDQAARLARFLASVQRDLHRGSSPGFAGPRARGSRRRTIRLIPEARRHAWADPEATREIEEYLLAQCGRGAAPGLDREEQLRDLVREVALLEHLARPGPEELGLIHLRAIGATPAGWPLTRLASLYERLLSNRLALQAELLEQEDHPEEVAVVVQGQGVQALIRGELGTLLLVQRHGALVPVQVTPLAAAPSDQAASRLEAYRQVRDGWKARVAAGDASIEEDPWSLQSVLRVFHEEGPSLDLRAGLISPREPGVGFLRLAMLAQLPPPVELTEGQS